MYQMERWDDSINALTKSLTLNPKNATAHNYLGIAAAEKGWQDAARKELETAVQLDPKYTDAWFNLAVVLGTWKPQPLKEEARAAYRKAVETGAEADSQMEKLLSN
jgi:superkiller protein 3